MSDRNSILLEVESLCCDLVDEIIDDQKLRRLEQLVLENPEAKRVYIEYLNLHAALGHYLAADLPSGVGLPDIGDPQTTSPSLPSATKLPSPSLPSRNWFWTSLTCGLVVLVLVGAWILGGSRNLDQAENSQVAKIQSPETAESTSSVEGELLKATTPSQNTEYVAELTWLDVVNEKGDHVDLPTGSRLPQGETVRIQKGDVQIRFGCGAEVTLHGPAVFHVKSALLGKLDYGSLEARVPPQAVGFLIDTPASRVIDLGTEFGLSVTPKGDTNIEVLNGEVEAEPRRPRLTVTETPRHKLFEGDSLFLKPPLTKSIRVGFEDPDCLDLFDMVRPDQKTCHLDPEAGLLTLQTQVGDIYEKHNNNRNLLVVPVPDTDLDAILHVKQFTPDLRSQHLSLSVLDDQDNMYRVSYWYAGTRLGRGFTFTREKNAVQSFLEHTKEKPHNFIDRLDKPFRLRLVRKGNMISGFWATETGPWIQLGQEVCGCKPRFVGFFAAGGNAKASVDCVIDTFELKIPSLKKENDSN